MSGILNGSEPDSPKTDNRKVRLRLQPVLPVSMEFYCECTNPPTLLPSAHTMLPTDPPQYQHTCTTCGETFNLNHSSGAVVYQRLEKPEDVPKLVVAQRMPS